MMSEELLDERAEVDPKLGERALSKLRWRCRRGLLENDLFIERFFKQYESTLTVGQANGLNVLMDLSDNDARPKVTWPHRKCNRCSVCFKVRK